MSKSCAKCLKTVYPLEELKCLDKIWHKGCFKCHECGMTLNMKTYKGFDKLPYCESHVPKAKATTVADTPEFKRISENTKIQSNAAYHAEFEKSKGKFTQVTDDPELMRIKQNTKIISNVAYHGDLEKKALMEKQRTLGGDGDGRNKNGVPPAKSPSSYMDEISSVPMSSYPNSSANSGNSHGQSYNPSVPQNTAPSYNRGSNNYNHEQEHQNHSRMYQQQQPSQVSAHQTTQHSREQYNQHQQQNTPPQHYQQQHYSNHATGNPSPYSSRGQSTNVIYTSETGPINSNSARKVGSINDYDPMNNYYGSAEQQRAAQQANRMTAGYGAGAYSNHGQMPQQKQQHHQQPPPPPVSQAQFSSGARYRALYDYEAQDVDELSFQEGDLIVDCSSIDEGWLTGTNLRSKQRGMLPANYVQQA